MGNAKEQLLTAKEVIGKFYNHFEKKSEKIVFHNKISVVCDSSSYFCDADGHAPSNDYAEYAECLKINSNIIAKGRLDTNYDFIRVFELHSGRVEDIKKKLKNYNHYAGNFRENIILLTEENGLTISPIMNEKLYIEKMKSENPNYNWKLEGPSVSYLTEKYYKALIAKKETLWSFIEKQDDKSEKYSPEIAGFLAAELENLLK